MGDRFQIDFQGEMVSAVEVDIKNSNESWSEYLLEDGTKIRMKNVVHQVARLDKRKPDGEPIYVIKSTNIVDARVPDVLKVQGKN